MKAEAYEHLEAWGHMLGSRRSYIRRQQEMASREKAPADVIYRDHENKVWHRFSEVRNEETLRYFRTYRADLFPESRVAQAIAV